MKAVPEKSKRKHQPILTASLLFFFVVLFPCLVGALSQSREERTLSELQIEDLMGLKVQAIANNPARRAIDLADIESLMELYGADLDWKRIEEYFELFDMSDLLGELEARYHVPR